MGEILSKPTPKVELPSGRVSVGGRVIKLVFTGETTVVAEAGAGKEFLSPERPRTSGPVEPVDLEGEAAGEMLLVGVGSETIDMLELMQYVGTGGDLAGLTGSEVTVLTNYFRAKKDNLSTLESAIFDELVLNELAYELLWTSEEGSMAGVEA